MRWGALGVIVGAAALTAMAWLQSLPSLTAADAIDVAVGALDAAGVDDVVVHPQPKADVYRAATDGDDSGEPAWRVAAAIGDEAVEIWIGRAAGELVYVDDSSADGSRYLLTDAQFEEIDRHRANPARDRRLRRNLVVTLAAALLAGTAGALASVAPARSASDDPPADQARRASSIRASA